VEIIFGVVANVIGILTLLAAVGLSSVLDYDQLVNDLEKSSTITSVIYGVGIVVSLIVIYGAIGFKASMVGLGIIWTVAQTVASIILQQQSYRESGLKYPIVDAFIRVVISGLLIYPPALFISEVRRGIMSRETYHREEYSCCCV
jgi:hypothetical protein